MIENISSMLEHIVQTASHSVNVELVGIVLAVWLICLLEGLFIVHNSPEDD